MKECWRCLENLSDGQFICPYCGTDVPYEVEKMITKSRLGSIRYIRPIKKWVKRSVENINLWAVKYPVKTAGCVFLFVAFVAVFLSMDFYNKEFYQNVLVELHGLLMDLLVIGVIVLWIDLRREKSNEINRLTEIIEDFSAWYSDESAIRVFGAFNRLRKLGITHSLDNHFLRNIHSGAANFSVTNLSSSDLSSCSMPDGDFRYSHLRWTIFIGAALQGADFRGANLFEADMRGADLTDANFSGTVVQGVRFNHLTVFDRAKFTESYISDLDLTGAVLNNCDLTGVKYKSVTFPAGFSPASAGMSEVTDDYRHEPYISLIKNRDQILKEPVSVLEKLMCYMK
jgi:hypothetical protein